MTFFISSSPESLKEIKPTMTVEAEFGEVLVEDFKLTLAHHGSRVEAKTKLDIDSFISEENGVILRKSNQFVNHLYRNAKAVVSLNTITKSITLSLADTIKGISCREIAQELWGSLADGHNNIAGSPRGKTFTYKDARQVAVILADKIN